jgi:hypothetical protein
VSQCTIELVQYVKFFFRGLRPARPSNLRTSRCPGLSEITDRGANEAKEITLSLWQCGCRCLLLLGFESLAPLFAVAVQGIEDDGIGFARRADLIDLNGFAFE